VSVRPSVCPVPDPKWRMEKRSKLKIGRKEARDTSDPHPHLEVKRSKIKVNRPLNAGPKISHIVGTGRPIELHPFVYDEPHYPHAR